MKLEIARLGKTGRTREHGRHDKDCGVSEELGDSCTGQKRTYFEEVVRKKEQAVPKITGVKPAHPHSKVVMLRQEQKK